MFVPVPPNDAIIKSKTARPICRASQFVGFFCSWALHTLHCEWTINTITTCVCRQLKSVHSIVHNHWQACIYLYRLNHTVFCVVSVRFFLLASSPAWHNLCTRCGAWIMWTCVLLSNPYMSTMRGFCFVCNCFFFFSDLIIDFWSSASINGAFDPKQLPLKSI